MLVGMAGPLWGVHHDQPQLGLVENGFISIGWDEMGALRQIGNGIPEIAAVPHLGGIFFGPFDLAVSMGAGADARDADVSEARARVYVAAKANGLPIFDLAWSVEAAVALIKEGAQVVAVGVDISIFAESCQRLAEEAGGATRRANMPRRRTRPVGSGTKGSGNGK